MIHRLIDFSSQMGRGRDARGAREEWDDVLPVDSRGGWTRGGRRVHRARTRGVPVRVRGRGGKRDV